MNIRIERGEWVMEAMGCNQRPAFAATGTVAQNAPMPRRTGMPSRSSAPGASVLSVWTDTGSWVVARDIKVAVRILLTVDGYEQAGALTGRIRDELVATLPADASAVVASRMPPRGEWDDPVWRERLRSIALRGPSAGEAVELLHRAGVRHGATAALAKPAHGHPLALRLLADLDQRGAARPAPHGLDADLVSTLLNRHVDVVPDRLSRRAIQVSALARVTTEPLLREALGIEDASGLFDWLDGLSFVDATPEGLRPHEPARDVLDLDLRCRDPEGYRSVFRGCGPTSTAR